MTVQFSIIVPTYNRAHLIARCLDSILKQQGDFEIIVVDDGSTDKTEDAVKEIAKNTSRTIHYYYQPNSGAGDARNLGAKNATGKYLLFLDSDDEALDGWLASFQQMINEGNSQVVCCGIEFVDSLGGVLNSRIPVGSLSKNGVKQGGLYLSGTFAIQAELFHQLGGYASKLQAHQHSELRCRLTATDCQVNNISKVFVRAHSHDGPNIRSNDQAKYESGVYVLETHKKTLTRNPRSYASWATATGGCAARLGKYQDARKWFGRAVSTYPKDIKNYARWLIALTPLLRRYVWGTTKSIS